MKVLIVASGNSAAISPFVKEQGDSLKEIGLDIDYFLIKGKGITGYLKNYFNLIRLVKKIPMILFMPTMDYLAY